MPSPSRVSCIEIKIRLQISEAKFTFGPTALISGSMMVRKQAHPFFLKLPSASFQVDPASNWLPLVASHLEVENDGSILCSDSLHNRPNGSRNIPRSGNYRPGGDHCAVHTGRDQPFFQDN